MVEELELAEQLRQHLQKHCWEAQALLQGGHHRLVSVPPAGLALVASEALFALELTELVSFELQKHLVGHHHNVCYTHDFRATGTYLGHLVAFIRAVVEVSAHSAYNLAGGAPVSLAEQVSFRTGSVTSAECCGCGCGCVSSFDVCTPAVPGSSG